MNGRDPSFVENELFMRSQTHANSTHPRQPWEQPGMLCVFNPVKAVFPSQLSIPYQGPQVRQTDVTSHPQQQTSASATRPVVCCQAWTRAVKAKRGPAPTDKRNEAFNKILSLLHAFSSFFDLASLLEDDENEGDSLRAVLAPKAPSTILKHAGPVRTFCEWLVKSNNSPPFGEEGGLDFCSLCPEDAQDCCLYIGHLFAGYQVELSFAGSASTVRSFPKC